MSLPVMAANTPGAASARETSTFLMTACAYGLRSTAPWMRPDSFTSAPYWARPSTLSTPSCLMGRLPTTLNSCAGRSAVVLMSLDSSALLCSALGLIGGALNGAHDLVVPGAPAEVAGQPETDAVFVRVGLAFQERPRRH